MLEVVLSLMQVFSDASLVYAFSFESNCEFASPCLAYLHAILVQPGRHPRGGRALATGQLNSTKTANVAVKGKAPSRSSCGRQS